MISPTATHRPRDLGDLADRPAEPVSISRPCAHYCPGHISHYRRETEVQLPEKHPWGSLRSNQRDCSQNAIILAE